LENIFARLAIKCDLPNLSLLSSLNYRHEPLAPSLFSFIIKVFISFKFIYLFLAVLGFELRVMLAM
jgi:hypothetical protein